MDYTRPALRYSCNDALSLYYSSRVKYCQKICIVTSYIFLSQLVQTLHKDYNFLRLSEWSAFFKMIYQCFIYDFSKIFQRFFSRNLTSLLDIFNNQAKQGPELREKKAQN